MIPLTQDFGKQKTAKIFLIITFFLEILQLLPKLAKFSFNTAILWAKYVVMICVGNALDRFKWKNAFGNLSSALRQSVCSVYCYAKIANAKNARIFRLRQCCC